MQSTSAPINEVVDQFVSRFDITSFSSNPALDPTEYTELCRVTGIDRKMQDAIIDYRNTHMCYKIRQTLNTIESGSVCAAVVGKNHIPGMLQNLSRGDEFIPDDFSPRQETPAGTRAPRASDRLLLSLLLS